MYVWQADELCSYWKRHPPVHLLVAGFVGYKAEDASAVLQFENNGVLPLPTEVLSIPGVAPGLLPANMPPAILDFDELMRQ